MERQLDCYEKLEDINLFIREAPSSLTSLVGVETICSPTGSKSFMSVIGEIVSWLALRMVVPAWQRRLLLLHFQTIWTESVKAGVQTLSPFILKIKCNICTVYGSFLRSGFKDGFTKNVQLYLGGLLPSAVCGHTFVSALISKLGLLDPEGCCVLDPHRKSIMKPCDLRAWLSLYHTWQSHSLTNQSFQEGGGWLNSGLCWEERTKFLKAFLIHKFRDIFINMVHSNGVCHWSKIYTVKYFLSFSSPEIPRITLNV